MEKDSPPPPPPPPPSSTAAAESGKSSIRALNKNSHKIAKATHVRGHQGPITAAKPESPGDQTQHPQEILPPPPQPQPPVYNINKNDFRNVVQQLTGSPVHHGAAPAKPAVSVPTASRLQRNRPPPLAQLGPRPPVADGGGGASALRPWTSTPLSPLPPLPTVSAAAESPITAYMRCLRGGSGGGPAGTMGVPLFPLPSSPLAFGCLPSPQSGFPSSPRVQVPSPKWEKP